MIGANLEEFLRQGLKDRKNLTSLSLVDIVSGEIKRLKHSPLYEASDGIESLSTLIKLKSELLLMIVGLIAYERKVKTPIEDVEISEIFGALERSFKEKLFTKRVYVEEDEQDEVPVLTLSRIVREIMEKEKLYEKREIERNDVSIQEITEKLKLLLQAEKKLKFREVISSCKSRLEVVVTFLAILLLSKTSFLRITQKDHFKEIYILLYEKGRVLIDN